MKKKILTWEKRAKKLLKKFKKQKKKRLEKEKANAEKFMSRKAKNLRTFLYQNKNPTIEEIWDCAWESAQKTYHSRKMQELEAEILRLKRLICEYREK